LSQPRASLGNGVAVSIPAIVAIAAILTKKASSHMVVSRALISAANRFLAKYDFADKKIAAPIGALLMTESTQRPFCAVFCGNWFVDLASRFIGKSYAKKLILKVSSTESTEKCF
jgi:hypothetical protein